MNNNGTKNCLRTAYVTLPHTPNRTQWIRMIVIKYSLWMKIGRRMEVLYRTKKRQKNKNKLQFNSLYITFLALSSMPSLCVCMFLVVINSLHSVAGVSLTGFLECYCRVRMEFSNLFSHIIAKTRNGKCSVCGQYLVIFRPSLSLQFVCVCLRAVHIHFIRTRFQFR